MCAGGASLILALYYYRYRYALPFVLIAMGIGLTVNCIRGLASREGMYDEANTSYMTLMQWVGIAAGLALTGWGCVTGYWLLELL